LHDKLLKLTQQIPDEDFVIVGDREKLTYALSELIAAAAHFAEFGGTIEAEFSHGRGKEATVKISDKDASIPSAVLSKIFERSFSTVAKPTAQNTDAVNLSGVYDVVGIHGGRLFVNSTAGRGATFLFTLPAITLSSEENSHEQAVNSGSRRR